MTDPTRTCQLCKYHSGYTARCCECLDACDNRPLFEAGEPVTLQSTARIARAGRALSGILGAIQYGQDTRNELLVDTLRAAEALIRGETGA